MPRKARAKPPLLNLAALRQQIRERYRPPAYNINVPTESKYSGYESGWSGILSQPGALRSLYHTTINPKTYLDKTSYGRSIAREKKERSLTNWYSDYRKIRQRYMQGKPVNPVQWFVWNHNCEILGHEGRHRAAIAQTMMKEYPRMRSIPLVVACVSNYSPRTNRYTFVPWSSCKRCYKDFPENLTSQKAGGGFDPRDSRWIERECNRCGGTLDNSWASETCEECMAYCEECGTRIDSSSRFCSNCVTHCDDCGTKIPDTVATHRFCRLCKRLRSSRRSSH